MVIEKPLRNIVGKGEHVGYHLFFSTLFFRAFFCMVVKTLDYVLVVWTDLHFTKGQNFGLNAFADDKLNETETMVFVVDRVDRKHCRKRRRCWLPAFSPFHTMFSKAFSFRVVETWYYVVKSQVKKHI